MCQFQHIIWKMIGRVGEKNEKRIVYDSEKCSEIRSNINDFSEEIDRMIDLII